MTDENDEPWAAGGEERRCRSAARDGQLRRAAADEAGGCGRDRRRLGEKSPERLAQRNGYCERDWETRTGTVELRIPKLHRGSYFPTFLEPCRMAEKALTVVIQEACIQGISTRPADDVLWQGVKARQQAILASQANAVSALKASRLKRARRCVSLLSGLMSCAVCGGCHRSCNSP